MTKSPITQTPIRTPRKGPGVAEHPAPRQGSLPPTIGTPLKDTGLRVPGR
jgi:hypothetical protein